MSEIYIGEMKGVFICGCGKRKNINISNKISLNKHPDIMGSEYIGVLCESCEMTTTFAVEDIGVRFNITSDVIRQTQIYAEAENVTGCDFVKTIVSAVTLGVLISSILLLVLCVMKI